MKTFLFYYLSVTVKCNNDFPSQVSNPRNPVLFIFSVFRLVLLLTQGRAAECEMLLVLKMMNGLLTHLVVQQFFGMILTSAVVFTSAGMLNATVFQKQFEVI